MALIEDLQTFGLSEKEAKVYLASLELGQATVQQIAKKANVNRPTCYFELESLERQGLVTRFARGKKTFYGAVHPESISAIMDSKESQVKLQRERYKDLLPQLLSRFNLSEKKPKVYYYEGEGSTNAVQEDYLNSGAKVIYNFFPIDYYDILKLESEYTRKRIAKRVKGKVIYISKSEKVPTSNKEKLREAYYIPFDALPIKTDIAVYGNKVSLVPAAGEEMAIIIENKEMAESFKALFDFCKKYATKR